MASARGDFTPPNPVPPAGPQTDHWRAATEQALQNARNDPTWPRHRDVRCRFLREVIVTGNPGDVKTYSVILQEA